MASAASRVISNLLTILILVAFGFSALYWRDAVSWWRANQFKPSPQLEQIVANTTMTPRARQLFYGSIPEVVADRTAFTGLCRVPSIEDMVELGCYTGTGRIFLLDLERAELEPVINVTAAHEMLHAAYAHMPVWKRKELDRQLDEVAAKLNSPKLNKQLENYQVTEPGQRHNELHSLLATEHAKLTPELEEYYSQYFEDRSQVVALNKQFEEAFEGLERELERLRAKIDFMRGQLARYEAQRNIRAYNSLVPEINKLIQDYNSGVARYNSLSKSLRGEEDKIESESLQGA